MATAKKATLEQALVKLLIWGVSGSGKSRFGLSAPNPLVIDTEGSTGLYANEFDFYVAEPRHGNKDIGDAVSLTRQIVKEITAGEYPDRETLVIDSVTDLLDEMERQTALEYEKQIGRGIQELNALQKTKWYSFRRIKARIMLDALKNLPVNLILIARAKDIWEGGKPSGQHTYDANPIVEYLMDVIIELRKVKHNEYTAHVRGSRLGNLPDILDVKNYSSITVELQKLMMKQNTVQGKVSGKKAEPPEVVEDEVVEDEPVSQELLDAAKKLKEAIDRLEVVSPDEEKKAIREYQEKVRKSWEEKKIEEDGKIVIMDKTWFDDKTERAIIKIAELEPAAIDPAALEMSLVDAVKQVLDIPGISAAVRKEVDAAQKKNDLGTLLELFKKHKPKE